MWHRLPPSRNFQARPLSLDSWLSGLRLHLKDAGLPWLFLEAFLLMGAFVTLFNYITYRLLESPFNLSPGWMGFLSLVFLSGTYSAAQAGVLSDRLGRARVFWPSISLMLLGLLLTLSNQLWLILLGMLVFTFGFFAAHSLASAWVGSRAKQARGQAAALYLFSYYFGSSLAGTVGGLFWYQGHWVGVVLFIAALLVLALLVAARLTRLPEPVSNG